MRLSVPQILSILAASGFVALVIVGTARIGAVEYAAAVPIALVVVGVVAFYPFLGLLGVVIFTQLDAIANMISEEIPFSVIKILTFVAFGGMMVQSYREPRSERFGPDELGFRFVLLFCLAVAISFPLSQHIESAVWSVETLIGQVVLFYLTIRLVRTQRQVDLLIVAVLASTLFSSCIAVLDIVLGENLLSTSEAAVTSQWEGESRTSGASDYDPTSTATMLLAGTTLAIFMSVKTVRLIWLTLPTALIGSAAIMLTFARSGAVVYAIAIAWLFLKFRRDRHFPAVVIIGLMVGASTIPFVPLDYWDRIASLQEFETDISLQRRLAYNLIGVELLIDNPVLGVGPGNFRVHFIDEKFRWYDGRTLRPRQLHNMYLSIAVETGLLGLSGFLGMILVAVFAVTKVWKHGSTRQIRLQAEAFHFCLVSFLIACVFVPNQYNKYTWLLTALAIAMARVNGLSDFKLLPSKNGRVAVGGPQ